MIPSKLHISLCLLLGLVLSHGVARGEPESETPSQPVYELLPEVDVPVMAIATTFALGWFLRDKTPAPPCAPLCPADSIGGIDGDFAGRWSPSWNQVGDVTLSTLFAGSLATVAVTGNSWSAAGTHGFVLLETILVTSAIQSVSTYSIRRPRPYMYGDKAPLEQRLRGHGSLSFFSGHTANSFSASVAMFQTLRRTHPQSKWKWLALGLGLGASSLVAVSRVYAGQHFPTDVVAGAVVGSSVGMLVPALHDVKALGRWQIAPTTSPTTVGLRAGTRF